MVTTAPMTRLKGSAMPLHERAQPVLRVIAAGMAVVFACTAAPMVLVAMDESTWATAGVGLRTEALWAAAVCVAGAGRRRCVRMEGRALVCEARWPGCVAYSCSARLTDPFLYGADV